MKNYAFAAIAAAVLFGGYMAIPKGIRNKNPLNVEYNPANNWDGQTGQSGRFATFKTSRYGIRAGAKLLRNYQQLYGLSTIQEIVNKWAPSFENNTGAYIDHVAQQMESSPAEYLPLNDDAVLGQLVAAMIKHENGINPYSDEDIQEAIAII